MSGASSTPTRWAIICPVHGRVFLHWEEYDAQMRRPNSRWQCPILGCGATSDFDDDNYEAMLLN